MCSPEHFAVEYAINPWMDAGVPVDRELAGQAVGRAAGDAHRPRPRRPRAPGPRRACRTWSTPPTAPSRSTAPSTAPGSGTSSGRRGRRAPGASISTHGWRSSPAERDQRGRGRLRVPAGGARRADPGRPRLPYRAGGARRGAGGAGPAGGLAAAGRPALLPPGRGAGGDRRRRHRLLPGRLLGGRQRVLTQLFPDAVLADDDDALAFGLNLVSDGRQRGAQQRGDPAWPAARRPPGTSRSRWS